MRNFCFSGLSLDKFKSLRMCLFSGGIPKLVNYIQLIMRRVKVMRMDTV